MCQKKIIKHCIRENEKKTKKNIKESLAKEDKDFETL